jgi:hypothetical protein
MIPVYKTKKRVLNASSVSLGIQSAGPPKLSFLWCFLGTLQDVHAIFLLLLETKNVKSCKKGNETSTKS